MARLSERPDKNEVGKEWHTLLDKCWKESPDTRPSVSEVLEELKKINVTGNLDESKSININKVDEVNNTYNDDEEKRITVENLVISVLTLCEMMTNLKLVTVQKLDTSILDLCESMAGLKLEKSEKS